MIVNQNNTFYKKKNDIDLFDIFRLLFSKLHFLIITGFVFAACFYFIFNFLVTPTYESRVSFYVNNGNISTDSKTIQNSDLQAAESLATTYSKILESNSVFDAVIDDLNENDVNRSALSGMVTVSVVNGTQLLEVVVSSNDAVLSCQIAQSFAKVAPTEIIRITKAGSVEVVDAPEVATGKSSPRTLLDTMIGFILGVFFAIIIIIIKEASDTTIYTPKDIETLDSITILGQIPEFYVANDKSMRWNLVKGGKIYYENSYREE